MQLTADQWLTIVGVAAALIAGYYTYVTYLHARAQSRKKLIRALAIKVFGIDLQHTPSPILCFVHPGTEVDACLVALDILVANVGNVVEEEIVVVLDLPGDLVVSDEHLVRRVRPSVLTNDIQRAHVVIGERSTEVSYRLPHHAPHTGTLLKEIVYLQHTMNRKVVVNSKTKDGVNVKLNVEFNADLQCKLKVFSKAWTGPTFPFRIMCIRAKNADDGAQKLRTITNNAFWGGDSDVFVIELPFKKHSVSDLSVFVYEGRKSQTDNTEIRCKQVFPNLRAMYSVRVANSN